MTCTCLISVVAEHPEEVAGGGRVGPDVVMEPRNGVVAHVPRPLSILVGNLFPDNFL